MKSGCCAYSFTSNSAPTTNSTLGETYAALCGQWAPQCGRELRSAPCFEIYLNSPENTEPEELLTDIYLPLEDYKNE